MNKLAVKQNNVFGFGFDRKAKTNLLNNASRLCSAGQHHQDRISILFAPSMLCLDHEIDIMLLSETHLTERLLSNKLLHIL